MNQPVTLIRKPTLRLNPHDDVVIAARPIAAGTRIDDENIACIDAIPAGHKVAVRDIAKGQPIRRYNQIIGFATKPIHPRASMCMCTTAPWVSTKAHLSVNTHFVQMYKRIIRASTENF